MVHSTLILDYKSLRLSLTQSLVISLPTVKISCLPFYQLLYCYYRLGTIMNNNLLYVASHLLRSRAHDITSQTVRARCSPHGLFCCIVRECILLHHIYLYTFLSICILNLIFYPFLQYPLLLANASESIGIVFFFSVISGFRAMRGSVG